MIDILELTAVVEGKVVKSNLPEFHQAVVAFVSGINRTLKTDEDFGQAEIDVKQLKTLEEGIAITKENALKQAESLHEFFATLDESGEEIRKVRLELSKLVDEQKSIVKARLITDALNRLDLPANARIAHKATMDAAIKGKRTLSSMQTALDAEVTHLNGKIEKNRELIQAHKNAHGTHLIPDETALLVSSSDALAPVLENRLVKFQAEEAEKKAKREKAEAEEKARLERAETERRIEEANAKVTQADELLPFDAPATAPEAAKAEHASVPVTEADDEVQELAAFIAQVQSSLSVLRPAREALKYPNNILKAKAFAAAVNPAYSELKGGAK